MRILIVKLSPIESNDSANIRTLGLAKGLIESQCSVDYLTIPNFSYTENTEKIDSLGNLKIIRTKSNLTYNSVIKQRGKFKKRIVGLLRKIYHALSIYDHTYSIAKNINISILNNTEYDLVISSSDPKSSHIAVRNLIKKGLKYKKWIQYWGDPMALDITKKSLYPKWVVAWIEKSVISTADKVIYVSPLTLTEQKKLFPSLANKMQFIPIPYIEEKINGKTQNDKFTIGYFGAYYSKIRNILPLYKACMGIKEDILLNIVGDSDLSIQQTEKVRIYPRGDISEFEKNADLLVCLLNIKGTQIPGKIYHVAATDKPVLVILDGDNIKQIKEYLIKFERFILCENNEKSIASAIKEIIETGEQFKPAPQFNAKTIAGQFIDSYNESIN